MCFYREGPATTSAEQQLADELADIDLNDPELAQAAAKIQKQFRGFKKGGGFAKKVCSEALYAAKLVY